MTARLHIFASLALAVSVPGAAFADPPAVAGLAETREQPTAVEPFTLDIYKDRRAKLMAQMKGGVAVILAAQEVDKESGNEQNGDFFYLTGLAHEAGAALILAPQSHHKEILLLRGVNPEQDRWTGYRAMLPSRELEARLGFDKIMRVDSLGGVLAQEAYRAHDMHYFGPIVGFQADVPRVLDMLNKTSARVPGAHVKDSVGMLARMRMVKEPRELEKIQRATDISIAGHMEAMRGVRPGMREWELKAILEEGFRKAGGRGLSYSSIVGAGPDAAVLHYPNDDRVIGEGELVLIDAASEFEHYKSDVTRTFPASGTFTPEQRKVYEVVLRAADTARARMRPGMTLAELHDIAANVIAEAGYYDYFIHGLGHPVGLSVHDLSDANPRDVALAENAVVTIEPGIYIPGQKIGIRLEDVVVMTKSGGRLLSGALPRTPDEIERFMAAAPTSAPAKPKPTNVSARRHM
jgi:Xaa-Pro aminopeptidase